MLNPLSKQVKIITNIFIISLIIWQYFLIKWYHSSSSYCMPGTFPPASTLHPSCWLWSRGLPPCVSVRPTATSRGQKSACSGLWSTPQWSPVTCCLGQIKTLFAQSVLDIRAVPGRVVCVCITGYRDCRDLFIDNDVLRFCLAEDEISNTPPSTHCVPWCDGKIMQKLGINYEV